MNPGKNLNNLPNIKNPDNNNMEKWPLRFDYVVWDFDKTIADIEAFDFLAELVHENHPDKDKILAEFDGITKKGMGTGESLPFDVSLLKRFEIIKQMKFTRKEVAKAAEHIRTKITPSLVSNKDYFESKGDANQIISGGWVEMMYPATRDLGINDKNVHANHFVYEKVNDNTDDDVVVDYDRERFTAQHLGKIKQIEELNLKGKIVMIGDGKTDAEVKTEGAAEAFVAYREHTPLEDRPFVTASADVEAHSFEDVWNFIKKQ